jgi:hypothetical protein
MEFKALIKKVSLHLHVIEKAFKKLLLSQVCREGFFILPYNELAIAQGPKIYQKKEL